jgi:hypothetical protein
MRACTPWSGGGGKVTIFVILMALMDCKTGEERRGVRFDLKLLRLSGGCRGLFFGNHDRVILKVQANTRYVPETTSLDIAGAPDVCALDQSLMQELIEISP